MTITNVLHNYTNGDFQVTLYEDGTLVRFSDVPNPKPAFPSTIDVKITDYCDAGCSYCHEASTVKGKHCDKDSLLSVLSYLPAGVELAIGGGNPLEHPFLITILQKLKQQGIVCNVTVNQKHLDSHRVLIEGLIKEDLIKGLGISVSNPLVCIDALRELSLLSPNIVFHLIVGVLQPDDLDYLLDNFPDGKFLLLGYKKEVGFGERYYSKYAENVDRCIESWQKELREFIGNAHLAFDNLALEQLKVKRLMTRNAWDSLYMGDDFTHSIYYDAVKGQYAPTSRSESCLRVSQNEMTILEYFTRFRNEL